jgi:pilus assembly protein CpaF
MDLAQPSLPQQHDRVSDVFATMLQDWLSELDLTAAYDQSFVDGVFFSRLVAQRLGADINEPRATRMAFERRFNMYLQQGQILLDAEEQARLLERLYAELFGFGTIEPLLNDPEISEIMVNGPKQVFVERKGRLIQSATIFDNDAHVLRLIQRILAPVGLQVNEQNPIAHVRLPDGSRVSVAIRPVSLVGPCLTIRKFKKEGLTIEDLIRFGSATRDMAEVISACVRARYNVIVSGGTGSGKSTLLNILSSFIPEDERIVTVEESAEMQLRREHVVTLEGRPPNQDGSGGISVRDLLRLASQMRAERIIVGELNGSEILDYLRLINRSHDGALTSMSANSPEQALDQIELLIKFNNPDLPVSYLRAFIGSAINLVVQINRLPDGSRKVVAITEVQPTRDGYDLRPIFAFRQSGLDERGKLIGRFVQPNPLSQELMQRLLALNIWLPPEIMRVAQQHPIPLVPVPSETAAQDTTSTTRLHGLLERLMGRRR